MDVCSWDEDKFLQLNIQSIKQSFMFNNIMKNNIIFIFLFSCMCVCVWCACLCLFCMCMYFSINVSARGVLWPLLRITVHYSLGLSIAVIKHYDQSAKRTQFQITVYHQRKSGQDLKQEWNLEAELKQKPWKSNDAWLDAWLVFLYHWGPGPGMALSPVVWDSPQQLPIRKMYHHLIWWGHFLRWGSLFPDDFGLY